MVWLLAIAAGLVAAGLALLAIPVRLSVHVDRTDRVRASWRVRAVFGLVDVRSDAGRGPRPSPKAAPAESPRRAPRRPAHVVAMLRTPGFVARAARLLPDLLRRTRIDRFHLRAEFGLDDPADTGRLYAAVAPLCFAAAGSGLDVRCQPSFPDARLTGSCSVRLSVRPLSVLAVLSAFVLSPTVWRAVRNLRSRR
jgi:hypothetical protein